MDYKDVIESKYNREAWQRLLYDIFRSNVSFWNSPSTVRVSSRIAKQALNLGKISLADGESIAVYEVELADKVDIERNRRGIRDMLTTDWRNMGYAGAFMFCYRQNESVLRFSYVSETWSFANDGSYKKESTDTRRFTYLLGEGHRSRTAIQQFDSLKKSKLSLKDLTKAFSVDAVSDMFFDDYKKQYESIIAFITGKQMVKVANKWEEKVIGSPNEKIFSEFRIFPNPEKAIRDYVKKLMGRLVFLQFLQKKGWLGVPVNSQWGEGDPEFIQHLFENTSDKDAFVDNVLEPLFNDINTERDGDIASSAVGNNIRVPYLNGGLFEPDAADAVDFPLPAQYMKSMLDFFASYNFTIDENDPDDAEMGVDPEMLGRIFENLLEDNKDKGAFYTPKEIVNYMCRESLIAYLQTDIEDEAQKEAIRQFVTEHRQVDNLPDNVLQNLIDVKICDPAIGSGAFPMGLLKELYLCRTALEGFDQKKAAEIKKHIIQQNIYGVDIERGAVDTARLRFWLSLIVDEESPEALPNLDFKIMQGNSLLEQYKGIDLSSTTEKKVGADGMCTIFDDMLDVYRKELRDMLARYYSCSNHQQKLELRQQIIDNVKKQMVEQSIDCSFEEIDLTGNDQFFMWHTWFHDVFSRPSKEGFDIVIGNPPYVDAKKLKHISHLLKSYGIYVGSADLYTYFYELSLKLLTNNGILTFITSNKWIRSEYGRNLRKLFLSNSIVELIDFGRNRLFGATVDSNIAIIKKGKSSIVPQLFYFDENTNGQSLIEMIKLCQVKNVSLTESPWLLKAGDNDLMKAKIESHGVPLKNLKIKIFRGILTGLNKAYHIDYDEAHELLELDNNNAEILKPLITGSFTDRYICRTSNLWLINVHNGIKGQNLEPIEIEKYPFIKQRLDRFYPELSKRNDKGGSPYHLRNCAYLDEFKKEKIIWQAISKRVAFTYDAQGYYYCDVTTYFMTGCNLKFILAILNSKLFEYALLKIYLEGDTFKSKNTIIQNFPIPIAETTIENKIIAIIDKIIEAKSVSALANIIEWENKINLLVYRLYDLTYEEVLIVDPETQITREQYEHESLV